MPLGISGYEVDALDGLAWGTLSIAPTGDGERGTKLWSHWIARPQWVPMRAILMALILAVAAACTGAQDDGDQPEPGTTPSEPSSGRSGTPVPIGCGGVIGGGEPGPEYEIAADAVALPSLSRPALQAFQLAGGDAEMVDSDVVEPGWYGIKSGLVARGATPIELTVPDDLINDMRIGWGQLIKPAASTFVDCADTDRWLAFEVGTGYVSRGATPWT